MRFGMPAHGGTVARRLWAAVGLVTLYAAAVAIFDEIFFHEQVVIHPNLHALLGTILGLFLGFRTNTAYDRWWEGRKLWGQLVNESRNLAVKVRAFREIERDDVLRFGRLIGTFARALKEHLREGVRPKDLTLFRNAPVEPAHIPLDIARQLREAVAAWAGKGWIDSWQELMLDRPIAAFMDICGSCERIRRTPLPASYRTFMRQGIAIYLVTLPWGLVYDFDLWTIPAVMMVSYFLIGLEMIAEEVEEPFGRGVDDLMLDDLCRTIEVTVNEALGVAATLPGVAGSQDSQFTGKNA